MKRKTAKEILAESFRELAGKKPVDKNTVPDIVENCGYSIYTRGKAGLPLILSASIGVVAIQWQHS